MAFRDVSEAMLAGRHLRSWAWSLVIAYWSTPTISSNVGMISIPCRDSSLGTTARMVGLYAG